MNNQQKLLYMIIASISVVCAPLEVTAPKHNTGIPKHAYIGSWIKEIGFSTEDQVGTSFPLLVMACGYDDEVNNWQLWAINFYRWHLGN